ncbi:MAG TPA: hypothetical protein VIR76_00500, partial [Pusillimonas sp.]
GMGPGSNIEFTSLDHAVLRWTAASGSVPLARQRLIGSSENERHFFSAMQGLRTAFSHLQIGKPQPLPISAPKDEQDKPVVRPTHLFAYFSRSLHISGPLRSASLLLPHTSFIAWNKAVLTLREMDRPSLRDSGLNLTLQGVLYENDSSIEQVMGHAEREPDGAFALVSGSAAPAKVSAP